MNDILFWQHLWILNVFGDIKFGFCENMQFFIFIFARELFETVTMEFLREKIFKLNDYFT